MKKYTVELESVASNSFRCNAAAASLDIDVKKKLKHVLNINADFETSFNVALIVGSSGSGKTTLAKKVFGDDCFRELLDQSKTILDQLPSSMTYDECANLLNGVGLSQVVCWIRPTHTLSNGQKVRAECALQMASDRQFIIIDEWTSVVDRTVAKVMSHAIQKFARQRNRQIVLVSCHYDVIEWLNPDLVIDCNAQKYTDWRAESPSRIRTEKLKFDIAKCDRSTWGMFSKYHYLSENLPGGHIETFGLFHESEQIGFQCFANYVPHRAGAKKIMHSNRTVIHPDYVGFGLGMKVINETSKIMHETDVKVMAKFSSIPVYKAMIKHKNWVLRKTQFETSLGGVNMIRRSGFRQMVKQFSFEFVSDAIET